MLPDGKSFLSTNMPKAFKCDIEKLRENLQEYRFNTKGIGAHEDEEVDGYDCSYVNGQIFSTDDEYKNHPLNGLTHKIVEKLELTEESLYISFERYRDTSAKKDRLKWHADHFLPKSAEALSLKGDQVAMNNVSFITHLVFFVLKRTPLNTDSHLRIGSVPYDERNCIVCGNSSIAIPDSEVKQVASIPDADNAGYYILQKPFGSEGEESQWIHSRDERNPTDKSITDFIRETLVVRISTPKDNPFFFDKYLKGIRIDNEDEDQLEALKVVAIDYAKKHKLDPTPIEKDLFFKTNPAEDSTKEKKSKLLDLLSERENKLGYIDVDDGKLTVSCLPWLENKFECITFHKSNKTIYSRSLGESNKFPFPPVDLHRLFWSSKTGH
jgi:hypothetical protein